MTELRRTRLLLPALRAVPRRPIFLMVVVSRYRGFHRAGVGRNLADQGLYDSSLTATPGLAVQSPQPALLLAELVEQRVQPLYGGPLEPALELLFARGHSPVQREGR